MAKETSRSQRIAVLFVHGIGHQVPGQALLQFAEPVVDWILRSSESSPNAAAMIRESVISDQKSHNSVRVDITSQGQETSLLIAESFWADSVPVPSASEVLVWGMLFVFRVLSRVGKLVQAGIQRTASRVEAAGAFLKSVPGQDLAVIVIAGFVFLISAVVALIVAISILAIASLLVVPIVIALSLLTFLICVGLLVALHIPRARSRVLPIATSLVLSIGDTYSLRTHPVRASAMVTRVAEDIGWICEEGDVVVVVAHSQGAVLALEALCRLCESNVTAFVTVGAAIGLLSSSPVSRLKSSHPDMNWINCWTTWDPVSSGPIGDSDADAAKRFKLMWTTSEPAAWPSEEPSPPAEVAPDPRRARPTDNQQETARSRLGDSFLEGLKAAGYGLLAAYEELGRVVVNAAPSPQRAAGTVRNDSEAPEGPEEWVVHNQSSFKRDHASYFSNIEQFVAPLTLLLIGLTGQAAGSLAALHAAQRWRATRVRVWGVAKGTSWVAGLVSVLFLTGVVNRFGFVRYGLSATGLISDDIKEKMSTYAETHDVTFLVTLGVAVALVLVYQWIGRVLIMMVADRDVGRLVEGKGPRVSWPLGATIVWIALPAISLAVMLAATQPNADQADTFLFVLGVLMVLNVWAGVYVPPSALPGDSSLQLKKATRPSIPGSDDERLDASEG
jgi:pimeloyl-ACP methyl ester carboxylesterase